MKYISDTTSSDEEYIPISYHLLTKNIFRDSKFSEPKSMQRLGSECIYDRKYHNFIIDTVDVHIGGEIININLAVTTRDPSWQQYLIMIIAKYYCHLPIRTYKCIVREFCEINMLPELQRQKLFCSREFCSFIRGSFARLKRCSNCGVKIIRFV